MSYLDDILTFSREPWAHLGHLAQVVQAHKISKGGVLMIPECVQKIKDWPVLKSGKEVATFLGFAGYYGTFIPQYSELTNSLNKIKKAEKFLWNEEIEQDFVELK